MQKPFGDRSSFSPSNWFQHPGAIMQHRAKTAATTVFFLLLCSVHAAAADNSPKRFTGPWDVARLQATTPQAEWGKKAGLTQEVFYVGEKFGGRPTRVFGYYARPAEGEGP